MPKILGKILSELFSELSTYGYIILFIYSFGGGFFAIIAAGVLSFSGKMDISLSIAIASVGNFIGDIFLYYFGRYYKKDVMKYIKKHRRKLAYSHVLIKKYGALVIFLQKYIYGVKTIVPIVFGLNKYNLKAFILHNAFASILWAMAFGYTSYYLSEFIMGFFEYLYKNPYVLPIFGISMIALIWMFLSKNKRIKS